ncbi:MAG TPA: phosphoribosylaminoimidazolesuccinocarboxamide synthase [Flavobacteriaceae bacterium]|nr:phosphoribosylaminoimidazolesuccinocarboxamide synthase [Flavobacteriaceae bacterium]
MERIYTGKTKDVYRHGKGEVLLQFKDDVTGTDGVFDPGANTVGLSIEGMGKAGLRLSTYFFEKLNQKGITTHFVSADLDKAQMVVKKAEMFGDGLEVICRFRAVGSFYRRYARYCEEGQKLDAFVEFTIKDDERGDPTISKDTLETLNILSAEDYEEVKKLTVKICSLVKDELSLRGLELYDIKLEFGRDENTGDIMLIDEISAGNMRVYKGDTPVEPLELGKLFFK